jgi:hypothetical protein
MDARELAPSPLSGELGKAFALSAWMVDVGKPVNRSFLLNPHAVSNIL